MNGLLPLIYKKRDGQSLSDLDIQNFVQSITSKKSPPDYQIAALLAFIVAKGMSADETYQLSKAMLESGKPFRYEGFPKNAFFVDKHSTGGVGDKITLPLAPLVTACDPQIYFPTISGRALGHTGGTVDKLESIPGFKTAMPLSRFYRQLKNNQVAFLSQTPQIAPADKVLYALRDATGTVSSIPLITASILSKKLSETLNFLIIDLKTGSGAFLPNYTETEALGNSMAKVLESFRLKFQILMTNMDTPLGHYSGNRLEVLETHSILTGEGPADSTELTKIFAALQLTALGLDEDEAHRRIQKAISSGAAFEKWKKTLELQGGKVSALEKALKQIKKMKTHTLKADRSGYLKFDVTGLGFALVELGAGRKTKADKVDVDVGFYHPVSSGTQVSKGQDLLSITYRDKTRLDRCLERLKSAIHIRETEVIQHPLVLKTI